MSRDQRCLDNWALLYAREEAVSRGASLSVVFNLVDNFPSANLRHYAFMIKGLAELEADLKLLEIPFFLLRGDPAETVPRFAERNLCSLLVMDFSPMRIGRIWRTQLAASVQAMEQPCSLAEVDAHNVVPCWLASPKKEYGARTIRSKINKLLPEYLVGFPPLGANPSRWPSELEQPSQSTDWDAILAKLPIDRSVP
jgi:deoxyribodipyrimidine photo-lyase